MPLDRASELRTMLFGLNVRLPFLLEERQELDEKIQGVQAEIRALQARLAHVNGDVTDVLVVRNRRGRPPKALIEAAAAGQVETPKRTHNLSEAGKEAIREAQRRRWAKLTPEQRAANNRTDRPKKSFSAEARKHMGDATRRRWENYTPEERKALVERRTAARRRNSTAAKRAETARKAANARWGKAS